MKYSNGEFFLGFLLHHINYKRKMNKLKVHLQERKGWTINAKVYTLFKKMKAFLEIQRSPKNNYFFTVMLEFSLIFQKIK
jgi:hypothetical protein